MLYIYITLIIFLLLEYNWLFAYCDFFFINRIINLELKNILHIIALLSLILLYNVNYIYNCAVFLTAMFRKI